MKRDVKCSSCADAMRKPRRSFDYYGEGITIVPGIALRDYQCDLCNAELTKGALVWCVSIWSTNSPYYSWEADYISIMSKQDADALRESISRLGGVDDGKGSRRG